MDRQVHRTWSDSSTDRATPPVAAAIQSLHLSTMQLPRDSWQNSSMSGGRAGKPSFATPNLSAALGAEPYGVDGADDGDVEAGGGGHVGREREDRALGIVLAVRAVED